MKEVQLKEKIDPYFYDGITSAGGFIAGGSVRRFAFGDTDTKDVDIFPLTEDVSKLKLFFENEGFQIQYESELAISYHRQKNSPYAWKRELYQLIFPTQKDSLWTYGTPERVCSNFDFSITKGYINSPNTAILVSDRYEKDREFKNLFIENITCPIGVTVRMVKYIKKGYRINLSQIIKLFLDWEERPQEFKMKVIEAMAEINKNDMDTDLIAQLEKAIRVFD